MDNVLKNITGKEIVPMNDSTKKRVLVIDGNNLYIRNYVMNPAVSTKGDPIGGIFGFCCPL